MSKSKVAKETRNLDIERTVLKCFLRTLKDRQMFTLYLSGVGAGTLVKYLLKRRGGYKERESPFSRVKSKEDVIMTLRDISKKMIESHHQPCNDEYDYVTMTVNHLLHYFIEGHYNCNLMELGEEVYCRSCNILFGDDIEDFERQKMEQERIGNEIKERMRSEMEAIAKGKRNRDGSWEIDGQGVRLGGMPQEEGQPMRPAWLDERIVDGQGINLGGREVEDNEYHFWTDDDDYDDEDFDDYDD